MKAVRIAPIIVLIVTSCAWSGWQIEYSDTLVQEMGRAGAPISKRVGHFATKQECLAAIDQAVAQSGDPTLRLHMHPAPGGYDETGTSSSGGDAGTEGRVWGEDGYGIPFYNMIKNMQQKAAERRMQRAHELYRKGCEEYTKGNWAAAIQWYSEALKLAPGDPLIQQHLKNAEAKEKAYALNRKGIDAYRYRNWAAAVQSFREALQATPDDPVIQKNLKEAEFWLNCEEETKVFLQKAARERKIAEAARETREAEQRRRLAQTDAAFADLQADALDFLGQPAAAPASAGGTLEQLHASVPPAFPVSATPAIDREAPPIVDLGPEAYKIIGLVGKNIKEAPLKLGEAVITALGGGSQLGIIKLAKGLSDEAGRSMQSAVDIIGRGYPEDEAAQLIKGSESRAMKICIDSFSSIPTPPSPQEQQEMEDNGRKWFNWLTQPMGGSR
ncbi:MAG: hypothetical protein JW741_23520 [Sedimentisphaerales bacterium]|nr:hypothetical protein [Sedimentisphaerales bacterium]